ncbi:MAG: hypothetical protein AAGF99_00465 [Bacteroidota bacterium]
MTVASLYQRFASEPLLSDSAISSQAWGDTVGLVIDEVLASSHPALLGAITSTAVQVPDTGHVLTGDHVVSVSRAGRMAEMRMPPRSVYEQGYYLATPLMPAYVVERGLLYILPSGGEDRVLVKVNQRFGIVDGDHELNSYPQLVVSAVVDGVRLRTLRLALDAASLLVDAGGPGTVSEAVTATLEAAPVLPALDLTGLPALPALPTPPTLSFPAAPSDAPEVTFPDAPVLSFPFAPTFDGLPGLPSDYADNEDEPWDWLGKGDPEQVGAAVQAKRIALERWQVEAQNVVAVYRADVEGYLGLIRAETEKVQAYRAEVEAGVARFQAYGEEVRAYVAQVEGQVARIRAYQAEVEAYGSAVQARSAEQDARIRAWLAQHVEGALVRWRAVQELAVAAARFTSDDRGRIDAESRARWQVRLGDIERRRQALESAVGDAQAAYDRSLLLAQTNGVIPQPEGP